VITQLPGNLIAKKGNKAGGDKDKEHKREPQKKDKNSK
jgi:hypothetical protein